MHDDKTLKKLELNHRRNRATGSTAQIDLLAENFDYEACKDSYWNPEQFSLLYATPLWEQSTSAQRVKLNQLYWVAYYSQIISAEIATIFFNQTSAAALYGVEDFRPVCDNLDLESAQERAHINAFKTISEAFEKSVFGERNFTYPMRNPYAETMIFHDTTPFKAFWKKLQLKSFALLSSSNAFIGCQYFAVRGVRTLNGKLIQHQLAQYYLKHPDKENSPVPAKISYHHFVDESYHFNCSTIVSHDVINSLPKPTKFERYCANKALRGSQRDHYHFSTAINGLFWYDPALYTNVYNVLRSPIFSMSHDDANDMMHLCFGQENEAAHLSNKSRETAMNSYREYLSGLDYVDEVNKSMSIMARQSLPKHLATNRRELKRFFDGQLYANQAPRSQFCARLTPALEAHAGV